MKFKDSSYYTTTYCNHAHDMQTGKPINHNCYVLPPKALRLEFLGDFEGAQNILAAKHGQLREHRGVKVKFE